MKFLHDNKWISYSQYKMVVDLIGDEDKSNKLKKFKDVLNTDVYFDGELIDVFVLELTNEYPVIQLIINEYRKFDNSFNSWENSEIRKILNSDEFLKRFNKDFQNIVKSTTVYTEDYQTTDRFWLLSHEEVGFKDEFNHLKPNKKTKKFDVFDGTNESRIRKCPGFISSRHIWWLRSVSLEYYDSVGSVIYSGYVCRSHVDNPLAVLPICTIG